jgi:hypothetical protein
MLLPVLVCAVLTTLPVATAPPVAANVVADDELLPGDAIDRKLVKSLLEKGFQLEDLDDGGVAVSFIRSGPMRMPGAGPAGMPGLGTGAGEDVPLSGLRRIQRLIRSLDLSGATLTADDWSALARMSELEWLALVGCDIGDEEIARLAVLPRLRQVILAGTRLGDAGLLTLAQHPGVVLVVGGRTEITRDGIAAARAIRQDLRVITTPDQITPEDRAQLGRMASAELSLMGGMRAMPFPRDGGPGVSEPRPRRNAAGSATRAPAANRELNP